MQFMIILNIHTSILGKIDIFIALIGNIYFAKNIYRQKFEYSLIITGISSFLKTYQSIKFTGKGIYRLLTHYQYGGKVENDVLFSMYYDFTSI